MRDLEIIKILLVMLIISLIGFFAIFIVYIKYKRKAIKNPLLIRKKKNKSDLLYKSYHFFSQFVLTKRYIRQLKKQIEIIKPQDVRKVGESTMKTAYFIWVVIFFSIFIILLFNSSIYSLILSFLVVYILNDQIISMVLMNEDTKLLRYFEKYLNSVRHYFHVHGMVDEAIYESMEDISYELSLHIEKIHEILTMEDMEEEVNNYNEIAPNKYVKTFLALCVTVIKYGDKLVDEQSLFLTNLKYLKQEINIELLKRQKVKYLFSGLVFMSIFPVFFLKLIESFGISCLPELKLHYAGAFGIIVTALIFFTTIMAYIMIIRLKENSEVVIKEAPLLRKLISIKYINHIMTGIYEQNYGRSIRLEELLKRVGEGLTVKQFLLKKILMGLVGFFGCISICIGIHISVRYYTINYVDSVKGLTSQITEKQVSIIQEAIKVYTNRYKNNNISREFLEEEIQKEGLVSGVISAELTIREVFERVEDYKDEYYKWYELIIAIVVGGIFYQIPYGMILFRKGIMQMNMEDEVIQFQSIILMLMHMDRMTIETVLEFLENFAVIFKASIGKCINNIESGDLGVLEQLKLDEPFEPFGKLIDNLIVSDRIGIEKAFDEIISDRIHYQDKRQQENEMFIQNKAIIGKVLAYIPIMLTIGLHLIIPFVMEGVKQLSSFMGQMQSL